MDEDDRVRLVLATRWSQLFHVEFVDEDSPLARIAVGVFTSGIKDVPLIESFGGWSGRWRRPCQGGSRESNEKRRNDGQHG